jgi:hypothetical protein
MYAVRKQTNATWSKLKRLAVVGICPGPTVLKTGRSFQPVAHSNYI